MASQPAMLSAETPLLEWRLLLGSLFLLPSNTGSHLKLVLSSSAHAALPQMFPVLHLLAGHFQSPEKLRTSEVSSNWNHREPKGSTTCPWSAHWPTVPSSTCLQIFYKRTHFSPYISKLFQLKV